MNRRRCINHIRKAWLYNAKARNMASCNHHYMGSMTSHNLSVILNTADFSLRGLVYVSDTDLDRARDYLEQHGFPWEKIKAVKLPEERLR